MKKKINFIPLESLQFPEKQSEDVEGNDDDVFEVPIVEAAKTKNVKVKSTVVQSNLRISQRNKEVAINGNVRDISKIKSVEEFKKNRNIVIQDVLPDSKPQISEPVRPKRK